MTNTDNTPEIIWIVEARSRFGRRANRGVIASIVNEHKELINDVIAEHIAGDPTNVITSIRNTGGQIVFNLATDDHVIISNTITHALNEGLLVTRGHKPRLSHG